MDKFRIVSEERKAAAGRIIKQTQKLMESFFRALPISSTLCVHLHLAITNKCLPLLNLIPALPIADRPVDGECDVGQWYVICQRLKCFDLGKQNIAIFAHGGQSNRYGPKPNAPEHVRGVFKPIQTALPGVHFTEDMPGIASVADRFTLVRSMAHEDLDHGSATYLSFTGRYHSVLSSNPLPNPTDIPSMGSVLEYLPTDQRFPYSSVYVNGPALVPELPAAGQYGGAREKYDPLIVGDPTADSTIPGLHKTAMSESKMRERMRLKDKLNHNLQRLNRNQRVQDNARLYGQHHVIVSGGYSAFDEAKN